MKFLFLDTETTGLPTKNINGKQEQTENKVLQLALMVMEGKKTSLYEDIVYTDVPIDFFAMATHNITPEMLEGKPVIEESESFKILNECNIPENFLIIQNAPFDLEMLSRDGFKNQMQLIDTLIVAKHLYPDSESHSLQYLRYSLGLYKKEEEVIKELGVELKAHDALGDVIFMKILFSKMFNDIKEQKKLSSSKEVLKEMLKLSNSPVEIKIFKFGKYKDTPVAEVFQKDKGYISWLLNNTDDKDMIYTLNKLKSNNKSNIQTPKN